MKNKGPSNFRTAGASPSAIHVFTSGKATTSSDASIPSCGLMWKRVARTIAGPIDTGSCAIGLSSILIARGFGVKAMMWTVCDVPGSRFFKTVHSSPL
jgi:hypothetical protein